jgi:hypothetical protein
VEHRSINSPLLFETIIYGIVMAPEKGKNGDYLRILNIAR